MSSLELLTVSYNKPQNIHIKQLMYFYPYKCHKTDNIKQNIAGLNLFQTYSQILHNTLQLNQCKLKINTANKTKNEPLLYN
jgi:hypothetical protein